MSLALSLALTACKDDSKKESKEEVKEQSKDNTPKEEKDKPTTPKLPQIGDQCSPEFFTKRCQGKAMLNCLSIDFKTTDESTLYVVTKEDCDTDESCTEVTINGETGALCFGDEEVFSSLASCKDAIVAVLGDDGTDEACYATTAAELAKGAEGSEDFFLNGIEGTIYELGWPQCIDIGNSKYFPTFLLDYCRTCAINKDYSYICEKDDALSKALIGTNLEEGAPCDAYHFVPRRLDEKSALVCYGEVSKVTCAAGLELAFIQKANAALDGRKYREPVCINPQEPECGSDVFTCAANEDDGATDSFLLKGCANTDKGRHFVTKENALLWLENSFTEAMKCGAKGCDKATGTCITSSSK